MARERISATQEEQEDVQLMQAGGDIERSLPRPRATARTSVSDFARGPPSPGLANTGANGDGGTAPPEDSSCSVM